MPALLTNTSILYISVFNLSCCFVDGYIVQEAKQEKSDIDPVVSLADLLEDLALVAAREDGSMAEAKASTEHCSAGLGSLLLTVCCWFLR